MEQIIQRHRHELKRRDLTVTRAFSLTPHMIRIVFEGEALSDFSSLSPDDHVKLIFGQDEAEKPVMREYTPRAFDTDQRSLTIDFAVHDAGPATAWAMAAKPGDTLRIGGPRGSAVVAPIFDWYLMIGDETALPAIARRVEELPEGISAITLVAVPGAEDEQSFETVATHQAHWVHRPDADGDDPAPLLAALDGLEWPEGKGFVWIAAEAGVARALRDRVTGHHGHPLIFLKASGYWTRGVADGSDKSLEKTLATT